MLSNRSFQISLRPTQAIKGDVSFMMQIPPANFRNQFGEVIEQDNFLTLFKFKLLKLRNLLNSVFMSNKSLLCSNLFK